MATLRKLMMVFAVAAPGLALGNVGAQAGDANTRLAQADAGAKYTIQVEPGEAGVVDDSNDDKSTPNRNTAPGAVADTISANPGLGEALQKQGIEPSSIKALALAPDNVVRVYTK